MPNSTYLFLHPSISVKSRPGCKILEFKPRCCHTLGFKDEWSNHKLFWLVSTDQSQALKPFNRSSDLWVSNICNWRCGQPEELAIELRDIFYKDFDVFLVIFVSEWAPSVDIPQRAVDQKNVQLSSCHFLYVLQPLVEFKRIGLNYKPGQGKVLWLKYKIFSRTLSTHLKIIRMLFSLL